MMPAAGAGSPILMYGRLYTCSANHARLAPPALRKPILRECEYYLGHAAWLAGDSAEALDRTHRIIQDPHSPLLVVRFARELQFVIHTFQGDLKRAHQALLHVARCSSSIASGEAYIDGDWCRP